MSSYPTGAPFVVGSDTSYEAAASLGEDTLGRLEATVLGFIRAQGSNGATDDEIEYNCNLTHQCASARRRTLVLKGYLQDSGRRRVTRQNRRAAVWVLGRSDEAEPEVSKPTKEQARKAVSDIERAFMYARGQIGLQISPEVGSVLGWLRRVAGR